MNVLRISLLCILFFFISACSGGSGITVSSDDSSDSIEAKSSGVIVSTTSDAAMYTFIIANYELPTPLNKMKVYKSAREEGRKRVEISLIGEKGSGKETTLKPGEYPARVGNTGSVFHTANSGTFYAGKGGKQDSKGLNMADMKEGKITIASVSQDKITGSVDLTDGTTTIKGNFTVNVS